MRTVTYGIKNIVFTLAASKCLANFFNLNKKKFLGQIHFLWISKMVPQERSFVTLVQCARQKKNEQQNLK